MCLCDSIIVCGPFVQDCDVRQCCCDRLFGEKFIARMEKGMCVYVLLGFACYFEVL